MTTEIRQANTNEQFDLVIAECRELFENKAKDYGTSWRILRPASITDQIFIKAQRIRTIQEKKIQKVEDGIRSEFIGILNYSIMALIQIDPPEETDLNPEMVTNLFNQKAQKARDLLQNKNHDYGEAWRDLRISSMVDLILMKLLRVKQIENNDGKTIVSEGLDANYLDIINYSVFCLIRISEETNPMK